jgi:hypothetical protein
VAPHELTSIMDSTTLAIVGMLIKEDDGWSAMSINKASSSHQRKIIDGGLPNSGDISLVKIRGRNDKDFRASFIRSLAAPSIRELMTVEVTHDWIEHTRHWLHQYDSRRSHWLVGAPQYWP